MFPEFFIKKGKEVLSFLQIVKSKATGDDEGRKKGVKKALRAMDEERDVYLRENREADRKQDSDIPFRKNGSDSGSNRDISAI